VQVFELVPGTNIASLSLHDYLNEMLFLLCMLQAYRQETLTLHATVCGNSVAVPRMLFSFTGRSLR
jgi:hypothetical protein